ncbi:hypothetical protein [Rhodococcus qingshengii]
MVGDGSCAWTGAVETAAEASAITINAWPSRRRIIASVPWFVGVCADFHSARTAAPAYGFDYLRLPLLWSSDWSQF